jgi:hypothetical protein
MTNLERIQELLQELALEIQKLKPNTYNPYEIGVDLYERGLGVSDIWGAVKQDSDINLAYRGYCDRAYQDKKSSTSNI